MPDKVVPLTALPIGKEAIYKGVEGGQGVRVRLTNLGLRKGIKLRLLNIHGSGPCAIQIGGTRLLIGRGMAQKVMVQLVPHEKT